MSEERTENELLNQAVREAMRRKRTCDEDCDYCVGYRHALEAVTEAAIRVFQPADPAEKDARCHCGRPVAFGFDGDPNHHRGMCSECDMVRCDAYPLDCPYRVLPPARGE